MFDVLIYCSVMINMKHGGHIHAVADVIRALGAHYAAIRAAMVRLWRGAAMPPRQAAILSPQADWLARLTRLDSYVASMA
jgi:hypothetical protein